MPIFFNPETGQFVPIYDDAAQQIGFPGQETAGPLDPMTGQLLEPSASAPTPEPQPAPPVPQIPQGSPQPVEAAPEPVPEQAPALIPAGLSRIGVSESRTYNPNKPPTLSYGTLPQAEAVVAQQGARELAGTEQAIRANDAQAQGLVSQASTYQAEQVAERQAQQALRDEALAEANAEISQALDEVPSMDSKRVFRNMNAFDKGFLTIASALNGMNVRFNQGKNGIAETLMQIAEQDMAAQRTNIETARDKVFRAERGYERQNAAWSQRIQDMDVGVAQRLAAWDRQLAGIEKNTSSEINLANIGNMRRQLAEGILARTQNRIEKIFQGKLAVYQEGQQTYRTSMQLDAQRDIAAGKNQPTPARVFAQSPFNRRDIALGVPTTEAEDKELRKAYGDRGDILASAQEYLRLRNQVGRRYGGPGADLRGIREEDAKRLDSAFGRLFYAVRQAATGAAASVQEDAIVKDIIGNKDGWVNASSVSNTEQLIKAMASERQSLHTRYKMHYTDDLTPVDVFDEIKQPEDLPELGKSSNVLAAARDAVTSIRTTEDPAEAMAAFNAIADYANSSSATAPLLGSIIAGSYKDDTGALNIGQVKADSSTRVLTTNILREEGNRLAAIAKASGDSRLAGEILAEAERAIEALKSPTPVTRPPKAIGATSTEGAGGFTRIPGR